MWIGLPVGLALLVGVPYLAYVLGYWLVGAEESPASKTFETPPVSVVVPTYNESGLIRSKLAELRDLEYPTARTELLVVDASTDDTPERVREFASEHDDLEIRLLEEPERRGVASAVNRAVEAASHDIIVRTDCDSTLAADAVTHAVANLQDSSVGGVTGRQTEVLGESKVEESYRDLQARNQALESHLDSTFIVHGPCFVFDREYFEPIEPDSLADDTEIAVRIRKQGKRILMDPEMRFAEAGTSDVRGRRRRKDRRAMGLLQLLIRQRDLLGRYGRYGRVVVPFNWWFLLFSPWLTLSVLLLAFGLGMAEYGSLALAIPAGLVAFVAVGQRDLLGPAQPLYAVFDSHLSLLVATIRLLVRDSDGTWEVDADSRERFEEGS